VVSSEVNAYLSTSNLMRMLHTLSPFLEGKFETNAEYMINSQSVTMKSAMTVFNNFVYMCS
jgi:hypothetical protein